MTKHKEAPTDGAATPNSGLTSALSRREKGNAVRDSSITEEFLWVFISPAVTEDELESAVLKAQVKTYETFKAGHSLVRLHNDLVQIASEIRRIAEKV